MHSTGEYIDDSYTDLPTSHLMASVPAAVSVDKEPGENTSATRYQRLVDPSASQEQQQPPNTWMGAFSVSSYMQYFNVDTDIVINRLLSSLNPLSGDFFSKIDANPDLYGLVWVSTTLVFLLASLGNCATFLTRKRADSSASWSFDVGYVNAAACSIYGYEIVVPIATCFLLQYLGSSVSLVKFLCTWGYSLFIFVLSSFVLIIPLEFLRWIITLASGTASASFIATNLKSYTEGSDFTFVIMASFLLQLALAVFIKVWFFP